MSYSNSVNGTLLGSFPATQRCKVRPCAMDTHGVDLPGAFRLDAGYLHTHTSHSNSLNGTMFRAFPTFSRYMLLLYDVDILGVAQLYGLGLSLALSDSTPDSSTARQPIPILSTGQCSAPSQLSNGVCYIPTR